jgi:G3E family GTPase
MGQPGDRIPVTVLTGFLGSGKTTLLNRILSENHGKRIAVIENEFGEIGIDQALVINADEEVFEMNNGCICCTVRGDLIRILGRLVKRRDRFDHILVETTGMADPGPVAQTFFVDAELRAQFKLDGIVTLVDAKHVSLHLDDSNECKEQIAFADVLVLNKSDLVSSAELSQLERRVRGINGMARVILAAQAAVPVPELLNIGGFDLQRAVLHRPTFLEPEVPFEWAGTFLLGQGNATLSLEDGPEPVLDMLFVVLGGDEDAAAPVPRERAVRWWSEPKTELAASAAIEVGPHPYRLRLQDKGRKSFLLRVPRLGRYGLYTQHLPGEFQLKVNVDGCERLALGAQEFAAGHTHDEEVGSVGIHLEGAVDGGKLERWLSTLLAEKGADIFRMKGILNVAGSESRRVVQGVHMLFDSQEDRAWYSGEARANDLVFIGRRLDRVALNRSFRRCLA